MDPYSGFAFGNARILACLVFLLCSCTSSRPEDVGTNVNTNLPFRSNPVGPWQVGYSVDNTLSLDQFRLSTFSDTTNIIALWHPNADASSGYYPYAGQNRDKVSRLSPTNSWAVRAGQIPMEASNTGQYSIIRYIAPADGMYKVKAVFEGVHFGLSSTDVHIMINLKSVFDDIIEGYGGDPAFHKVEGTHPSTSYVGTLALKKNDIITFATGYGQNQTHFNDTTGLLISIAII